jgi:hypothetical protein
MRYLHQIRNSFLDAATICRCQKTVSGDFGKILYQAAEAETTWPRVTVAENKAGNIVDFG